MNYKINAATFTIQDDNLSVNKQPYDCKQNTLDALNVFLNSKGKIISKDDLLEYIWKDVIVSEASVFKQVQLVRKIFAAAGLPKDIIENVYGKGYRIKYSIKQEDNQITAIDQKSNLRYYISASVLVLAIAMAGYYMNNKQQPNYLTIEKRKSMVSLMNNDWQKGFLHIQDILKKDIKHLSKDDMAFLYEKKALTQYHLQNYQQSIQTNQEALARYRKLNNLKQVGQIHLNIAKAYGMLSNASETNEIQQKNINKAIHIFSEIKQQQKMIDAQMVLARFYRKNNKVNDAIKIYQKTIKDAQKFDDKVGEMIALNNLAATYVTLNNFEKAIKLGQKGLEMTLEIGIGRYIASSYSFLSDLYQEQYRSIEALNMIEQAIKYQLTNKDYSYLGPKLLTLNFLMIQTYQHKKAEELLKLSNRYAQSLNMKNGLTMAKLYQGIDAARQKNWNTAEQLLAQSLEMSQSLNIKYKQPLNMAYLALAHYFNNNYLQAIEPATKVFNDETSDHQAKAIAALALAYTYALMEKNELANKWYLTAQNSLNPKWLFEYKLLLLLKLERQNQNNSILISQTKNEIKNITKQMTELTKNAQIDEKIYNDLKTHLLDKIANKQKSS